MKKTMITLIVTLLACVCSTLLGYYGCKYYGMYRLHKDIELNTTLHNQNKSTELNDSYTNKKIYTFNWLKENM